MTDTSRRTFLGAGALAVVAAPLLTPGASIASAPASPRSTVAGALYRRSRFAPLVGAAFTVVAPTRRWRMSLSEVGDLQHAAPGADGSFTLTFGTGVAGPPQGAYTLRRRGFRDTTLFLVPSDAERRTYEAVINSTP